MRDQKYRGSRKLFPQRLPDPVLCLCIHGGQGIIKNHHRLLLHQQSGNRDTLLLSAGKRHTALSHQCIKALREFLYRLCETGGFRCFRPLSLCLRTVRFPRIASGQRIFPPLLCRNRDILPDRSRKEKGLL